MERETMVIDGRLHVQGEDGYFHCMPISMDEARMKDDVPVYRMEDGKPVAVNLSPMEVDLSMPDPEYDFASRKVWVAEDAPMPDLMREHVRGGGSLYLTCEPENDMAYVSTDMEGHGLSTYIPMDYVRQEVRIREGHEPFLPYEMEQHIRDGGRLYAMGSPIDNGNVMMVTTEPMVGDKTDRDVSICAVKVSDMDYVTGNDEQDFADAVASIPVNGQAILHP